MTINVDSDLEAALNEHARRQGVTPETLAVNVLRQKFIASAGLGEAQDEWEQLVLGLATHCGHSLPADALSSEGLYE